ncbi:3-dehydroquinate synthase [Linum perenne]
MAVSLPCAPIPVFLQSFPCFLTQTVHLNNHYNNKAAILSSNSHRTKCCVTSSSSSSIPALTMSSRAKKVWVFTQSKQVMTAAVERGWNTFVFLPEHRFLADEWSSIALIRPLFIEDGEVLDAEKRNVATIFEVSTLHELQLLNPQSTENENVIVDLRGWQIIPAENIVAAFQGSQKTVFAISKSPSEAQVFLEALEHGLGGVILKVEDVEPILELKVGSFARGLFLVHSECLESNYIASRPFRVNAGPVHAYISVPGGKTCYLSELKAGKEVIIADQNGHTRTAITGRVKIETRPLVLVEAKVESDSETTYTIFLQNAETVALIPPSN